MSANFRVHTTHCCPVHGCKYGDDDCVVATGLAKPEYPNNNGCERCEYESNKNRTSKVGKEVIDALEELISRISQDKKEFMEAGCNLKGHSRALLLINEFKDQLQKQ